MIESLGNDINTSEAGIEFKELKTSLGMRVVMVSCRAEHDKKPYKTIAKSKCEKIFILQITV